MKKFFCIKTAVYLSSAFVLAAAPMTALASEEDALSGTPVVEPQTENAPPTETVAPYQATLYVTADSGVNVRSGPSTDTDKIGKLKHGTELKVTGVTADNWYRIEYSGGIGYVRGDNVSDTRPAAKEKPKDTAPDNEAPDNETPDVQTPVSEGDAPEQTEQATAQASTDTGSADNNSADDSSTENDAAANPAKSQKLFGTPVIITLAAAIIGVLGLIIYSVIGLFKKEYRAEEYYGDENSEYSEASYDEYADEYSNEYNNEDENE